MDTTVSPSTEQMAITPPDFEAVITREEVAKHERDLMGNPRGIARRVSLIALTHDTAGMLAMINAAERSSMEEIFDLVEQHESYCRVAHELAQSAFARLAVCLDYVVSTEQKTTA